MIKLNSCTVRIRAKSAEVQAWISLLYCFISFILEPAEPPSAAYLALGPPAALTLHPGEARNTPKRLEIHSKEERRKKEGKRERKKEGDEKICFNLGASEPF